MKKSHHHTSIFSIILSIAVFTLTLCSCKKLIENNPSGSQLLDKEVFNDSTAIKSTLVGLYTSLNYGNRYSVLLSTLPAFSADEMTFVGNTYDHFIGNVINVNDADVNNFWAAPYGIIYQANAIIEGTSSGSNLSPSFQARTIAEARFVRAFCYFYLINIFGDVPLVLTTDVEQNKLSTRTPVPAIYGQIIEDLLDAQANLPADYAVSGSARVRANKWAATALLARTYLYQGNWAGAEAQATAVIENTSLFGLEQLARVFTPTSKEAILQFYNESNGYTSYASAVLPSPVTPVPKYVFTDQLKKAFLAEDDDARRTIWLATINYSNILYTYPTKYRSLTPGANAEYFTVLRLAEQYLIRAEARAQQNKVAGAREDLFAVRNRAGLGETSANDKDALLLAVERERQVELNSEMGHRWFDLKRTGRADAVLGAVKASWTPEAARYPVPADQRSRNGNLTQNPGYN